MSYLKDIYVCEVDKLKSSESVPEFLGSFSSGTRRVYKAGLKAFKEFYESRAKHYGGEGESLEHFLDTVEEDLRRPRRQKRRVARNLLKGFVAWLKLRGYAPKSIRAYVSAVQSFAGYYDLKISTKYVDMPSSNPISDKFPWTLDKVAAFIGMIEDPEIKSIAVTIFQSGLSISDILSLIWGDIKYEYQRDVAPLCYDLARIKTDTPFMTFIGSWGVSLLRSHLKGKRLRLEDPLYTVSHRLIDLCFEGLGKKWVGEYKGQNPMRPHSLRAGFRTILGEAGMPYDTVEFFMGHELPEQVRVYNSRTRDGWRRIYVRFEPALTPKVNAEVFRG